MGNVIKDFKCKFENKIYRAGSDYKGDRLDELIQKGFIEAPKKQSKKDTRAVK